ncbi:polysaccharide pyruvyl transferase family protein [Xanthomonas sp. AmX2]|uniref:polysaccharide pyruvyl transferase family protein n=1 Tax=Xanthomonas sp. TaxID=29446 RepID=UPI001981B20F|nr:polysaccharide pyruvyl transferase family protein [Xanthomonas sp.]MBN6151159.1 polysaccharide pyruvyl transferase family protein [Xanthomonas sp.]
MPATLLEKWIEREERRALYWWQPKNGEVNIGDHLSKVIVGNVLSLRDRALIDKRDKRQRLIAIGSVLHFARSGDVVWGSGINGKIPADRHRFEQLDVRAVRGPKTRQFLQARGITVPEVYGDPGLLMPLFFPRQALQPGPSRPFAVIPHFNEPASKYQAFSDHLIFPNCKPATFVRQLLSAQMIVSSSLHGLILAEAYGIPAVYLDWGNGEERFKYDDYYHGTGRQQWHAGHSVEECLELGGNGEFDLAGLQRGLLESFPHELW